MSKVLRGRSPLPTHVNCIRRAKAVECVCAALPLKYQFNCNTCRARIHDRLSSSSPSLLTIVRPVTWWWRTLESLWHREGKKAREQKNASLWIMAWRICYYVRMCGCSQRPHTYPSMYCSINPFYYKKLIHLFYSLLIIDLLLLMLRFLIAVALN